MEEEKYNQVELVHLTAEVVSAYVSKNNVVTSELPTLIGEVYDALSKAALSATRPDAEELKPAVAVKKSVTDEYLVCLNDGKKFKSLKRHLRTHYNLSPEQYREKWNLPADYPMVAPSYAKKRSKLAKDIGLGTSR